MKQSAKILVLFIAIFAFALQTNAQSDTHIKIIPKAGFNVSRFDANWDDFNEFEDRAKVGWQAGIDARFGRFLYFSPGVHYQSFTMRNVSRDELEGGFNIGDETTIQSLKMPLNAGFKIPLIGVRAQAGITPSYVLNIKTPNGSNIGTEPLNKVGLATNLGVGMDILFLTLDLTWEKARVDFFKNIEGKNNMFTLTAGIKF
jgi:hypothetical protein